MTRQFNRRDSLKSLAALGAAGTLGAFSDLASGYVQRSLAELPKQGSRAPWRLYQNYIKDVRLMRKGPLVDEGMTFQRPASGAHLGHTSSTPDRQPAASGPRNPA